MYPITAIHPAKITKEFLHNYLRVPFQFFKNSKILVWAEVNIDCLIIKSVK